METTEIGITVVYRGPGRSWQGAPVLKEFVVANGGKSFRLQWKKAKTKGPELLFTSGGVFPRYRIEVSGLKCPGGLPDPGDFAAGEIEHIDVSAEDAVVTDIRVHGIDEDGEALWVDVPEGKLKAYFDKLHPGRKVPCIQ